MLFAVLVIALIIPLLIPLVIGFVQPSQFTIHYSPFRASLLITPGPEVGGPSGWCDMEHGIQAVQRRNSEILLLAEDDWKSKIILYRLPPPPAP